ncbi:MAG: hypothetical protein EI684_18995 [Candidatus Viridilinea halotolerans]|uniref:Uncharacterized protein n=1 Tax=Candidatus Viridilinea halotolerans TaxID=2491704 RepID=A0A426TSW4_9CHLR|nr:MAG: hypothetical protein EI684_18995 [Candidatus Viridilinea halotolerans]
MNIWDENKVLFFIAFVVPGFIAIKVYELLVPSRYTDSSRQIVDAVSYSCINYAILLLPIYFVERSLGFENAPVRYILFWSFVLFVAPIIWVMAWRLLRQWRIFQSFIPHPVQKPWDFVFGKRRCYWVVVTLKDGDKIAGKFCDESFASSAPAEEQIYLEEEWVLNQEGGFERPAFNSAGIIILASEIRSVEFYKFYNNEVDEDE